MSITKILKSFREKFTFNVSDLLKESLPESEGWEHGGNGRLSWKVDASPEALEEWLESSLLQLEKETRERTQKNIMAALETVIASITSCEIPDTLCSRHRTHNVLEYFRYMREKKPEPKKEQTK